MFSNSVAVQSEKSSRRKAGTYHSEQRIVIYKSVTEIPYVDLVQGGSGRKFIQNIAGNKGNEVGIVENQVIQQKNSH